MTSTDLTRADLERMAKNVASRGTPVEISPNKRRIVYVVGSSMIELQFDATDNILTIGNERETLQSLYDGKVVRHRLGDTA